MELLDDELASGLLQDALAFIDAYEEDSACQGLGSRVGVSAAAGDSANKPRKKAKPCSSLEARKRGDYKAELDWLRHDVAALEATLAQLKQDTDMRCFGPTQSSPSSISEVSGHELAQVSAWKRVAVRQLQKLSESELKNRSLRKLLAKQLKVAKVLQALVLKTKMDKEAEMAVTPRASVFTFASAMAKEEEQIYASLMHRMQHHYSRIDWYLESTKLTSPEPRGMSTRRKLDPDKGVVLETTSSVPLPLTLEKGDDLIWNDVFLQASKAMGARSKIKVYTEDSVTKDTVGTLGYLGRESEVYSRIVLHRYKEPGRVVYAYSSTALVHLTGQRILEDGLMILERDSSPKLGTMFKTWRRMHIDGGRLPTSGACEDEISEGAWLDAMGKGITRTHRRFENFLLDSVVERDSQSALGLCDL